MAVEGTGLFRNETILLSLLELLDFNQNYHVIGVFD